MDARRLGTGIGLPQAFLEASAPGYLTAAEWDGLREDWLEKALATHQAVFAVLEPYRIALDPRTGRLV
jgi:hypothetical protein